MISFDEELAFGALLEVAQWLGFRSSHSYNHAISSIGDDIWDDDKRRQWQREHQ